MGLFGIGKKRIGSIKPTDGSGRHFAWTIPDMSSYQSGTTLDSENVICFTKCKFHFHMALGSSGDIGLYVHYKKPPIPKYSYCFENAEGEVMRQHTAHTVPADTERCGHWNVCNHQDLLSFLGTRDTLIIRFSFDDDSIVVKRFPEQNLTSVMWTVPNVYEQNLNPFSSRGFFIDNTLIVARIDIKRKSGDATAKLDAADITNFIFFLFCRKGKIPAHSIELLDSEGQCYMKAEKKDDGSAQTLIVDRALVDKHLGSDSVLFVKIDLTTGGNPLEALNALSALDANANANANGAGASAQPGAGAAPQKVELGENKELYDVMED